MILLRLEGYGGLTTVLIELTLLHDCKCMLIEFGTVKNTCLETDLKKGGFRIGFNILLKSDLHV